MLVKAIAPTLGPRPRQVAMTGVSYDLKVQFFDNGADIARHIIQVKDPDEDMGTMFLREMLWKLQLQVGDGTATAAVLFGEIFNQGVHYLVEGGNAPRLNNALQKALVIIMEQLNRQVIHLDNEEQLVQLAASTCNDQSMAKLLGEIFDVVGEFGQLVVTPGNGREHEREYYEGMHWNRGLHSREMITDKDNFRTEIENAAILISDLQIRDPEELYPVLELALREKLPGLFIMADTVSPKALNFLLSNRKPEVFTAVTVQVPGFEKYQWAASMNDLAVIAGGTLFARVAGSSFKNIKPEDLGHARRAWADMSHFAVIGGKGDSHRLRKHINSLRSAYENTKDLIQKEEIRQRIGRLMGGSASLQVGGFSEEEIKAKVELAKRTVASVRSAMLEGVLPGGGLSMLECIPEMLQRKSTAQEDEERAAYHILSEALAAPFRTIVHNAGYRPDYVMAQMHAAGIGHGFDVNTGKVVQMDKSGILDPAATVKTVVFSAISSAALALTVDVLVHHKDPPVAPLPGKVNAKEL